MNPSAQPHQFGIDFGSIPSFPENATDLPTYYTVFKNVIKLERDKIRRFHRAGAGGREVIQAHTSLIDAVLRHLILSLASQGKSAAEVLLEEFSLVAVGGYGRGELNPFSDIDLLFLRPRNIHRATDLLIQDSIPAFWGLGLEVGQSCRTLQDCLTWAQKDLTIKTSMIETRFLIGSSSKYEKFHQSIGKNILKKNINEFLDAKAREKALRYKGRGGPGSNPEPNIKEDAGGLRDYHTALWAVAVRFGCLSFREIPRDDIISAEELGILDRSLDFSLRVRNELHYLKNKKIDTLTRETQKDVSTNLGYNEPNEVHRVERFMRDYFLHATNICQYSEIIFQRCIETRRTIRKVISALTKKNLGHGFHAEDGTLTTENLDPGPLFEKNPDLILRAFELCRKHSIKPTFQITRHIRRHRHLLDEVFLKRKGAKKFLFSILENPLSEKHLRLTHEVGVLGQLLPEFGRSHCRVSYDFYHRYTADEHSLRMIRFLEELESKPQPHLAELSEIYNHLTQKTLLKFSALLQSIGKDQRGGETEERKKVLSQTTARLGLEDEEARAVDFLIENAYLMVETALHKDIHQPAVIESFAKTIKTSGYLDLLYLFSYAELRAVAPNTWNSWKKMLFSELYKSTHDYFKQPESLHSRPLITWVEIYKALHWEFPPEEMEFHFRQMPEDYLATVRPEEAALHMRLIRSLKDKLFIFNHNYNEVGKFHHVVLCCSSKFEAFKILVGTLTSKNINILGTQIYLRKDGIVIISTQAEETKWLNGNEIEIWKSVNGNLRDIFEGRKDLPTLLAGRARYISSEKQREAIVPKVQIDNTGDSSFSVIRIEARDHIGMLYKIAKVFSDFSIQVHSTKISTQGGCGIDIFYVSLRNQKVTFDKLICRIKEQLVSALLLENPEDVG